MASVSTRGGRLYFDFRYRGQRCREYTRLEDTQANRRKMEAVLARIEADIEAGTFNYASYFPGSDMARRFGAAIIHSTAPASVQTGQEQPLFQDFANKWKRDKSVEWRYSYQGSIDSILTTHLLPEFGLLQLHQITRDGIIEFRRKLAEKAGHKANGETRQLSATTINRIMGILKQLMDEATLRHGITNPYVRVKRLNQRKTHVDPFTLEEARALIEAVRSDYRNYLTTRFFTGMRPGELHGLKWKHVDFSRREILVRETYAHGRTEYTKTDGSQREVDMSQLVYDALKAQKKIIGDSSEYVFCNRTGRPVDNKNFDDRVWRPLLRFVGLKERRPYQMRHTCATLWLAAGENPEWIAKQLGQTTTEMLFRVYSRYVPNLTRKDGSAFDRLISQAIMNGPSIKEDK